MEDLSLEEPPSFLRRCIRYSLTSLGISVGVIALLMLCLIIWATTLEDGHISIFEVGFFFISRRLFGVFFLLLLLCVCLFVCLFFYLLFMYMTDNGLMVDLCFPIFGFYVCGTCIHYQILCAENVSCPTFLPLRYICPHCFWWLM